MGKLRFGVARWMCGLIGIVLGACALPALSQPVEWKMHIVWVPAREEAKAYQKFVDLVNERAKGKLNITLHAGATLGVKDADMLRVLPPGNVIQIAGLYPWLHDTGFAGIRCNRAAWCDQGCGDAGQDSADAD